MVTLLGHTDRSFVQRFVQRPPIGDQRRFPRLAAIVSGFRVDSSRGQFRDIQRNRTNSSTILYNVGLLIDINST